MGGHVWIKGAKFKMELIITTLWFFIVVAGGALVYSYLCNLDFFRPRHISLSLTTACMWFVLISSAALLSALLAPGGWNHMLFLAMEGVALACAIIFGTIALVDSYLRDGPRW